MPQISIPRIVARKTVVVLCGLSNCGMTKFLQQEDFGLTFTFFDKMTDELAQLLESDPPDLFLLHTNGDSYQDWSAVVGKLKELMRVPVAVMSDREDRRVSFVGKVELTVICPHTYDDRVRFVSALILLARGIAPGVVMEAVTMILSGGKELQKSSNPQFAVRRVIIWILPISLLLATVAAAAVTLATQNPDHAMKTFEVVLAGSLGFFTSAGVITHLTSSRKRLKSNDAE